MQLMSASGHQQSAGSLALERQLPRAMQAFKKQSRDRRRAAIGGPSAYRGFQNLNAISPMKTSRIKPATKP
jgi:hypothetical protein